MKTLEEAQAVFDAMPEEMRKQWESAGMGRPESLDPELEAYLEVDGPMGPCIRHPLHYDVLYDASHSALANNILRQKREMLAEAQEKSEWGSYIFLHERPYRLEAFGDISIYMDDGDYWEMLGRIWIDSENIWQNLEEWTDLMTEDRSGRERIMDEDDFQLFEQLPDTVTVYRGFQFEGGEESLSWTLDEKRAKWFARRWQHKGDDAWVAKGRVPKDKVIAFLAGRNEAEIVVPWWDVCDMNITEVEVKNDSQ